MASSIDPSRPWPSFTSTYHHNVYPKIDPSQAAMSCKGRAVLVTGAGSGIGRAIAVSFARAYTATIVLLGRTRTTLDETAHEIRFANGGRTECIVVTADITSTSEVDAAFEHLLASCPAGIDILVNNAGGLLAFGAIADTSLDGFRKTFDLNVFGTMNILQAFCRATQEKDAAQGDHSASKPKDSKTIINITSGSAHIPYAPGAAAYASSKLANAKLVEYLHYEHPEWLVMNVQPGVVDTELARKAGRKAPDSPLLVGGLAVWLATQPQAKSLNGRLLWANWDLDEVLERVEDIEAEDLLTLTLKGWAEDTTAAEMIATAKGLHRNADQDS